MNANGLPGFLQAPSRYLFFTGKGGVGKTSLSAAAALALADAGKSVLLVSTDAASNLDEMLGVALRNTPTPVPQAPRLSVLNIDPTTAAETYRQRVIAQMAATSTPAERATVREQLSGSCTTEIAAFDEFAALLAEDSGQFEHVIFDTAPTGHTLRLLSLPKAWSGFLADNDRGASCLGPHSGLKMQESRFRTALAALCDATQTTVILVTRPDAGAIAEVARTAAELHALGLDNQRLAINSVFQASDHADVTAMALQQVGDRAIANLPDALRALPCDEIPLRTFDTVGLPALRALLQGGTGPVRVPTTTNLAATPPPPGLNSLADELALQGHGLIMVMGKGGVGKTAIAAALAIALVHRGHSVHLSTTDPAAHLATTVNGSLPGLSVDRIDPKAETARYIARVLAQRGPALDEAGRALLLEDLQSPCTEEVAVFHAFSRTVSQARSAFVVLDTAPTGHSLLLMDATGAYHRQMVRELDSGGTAHIVTPLMRLQDPGYTRILLVTLPEATPVSQAQALQDDLRRAQIEPYAWILNKSLVATGTRDPLLQARLDGERRQMQRIAAGLATRCYTVPWLPTPPIGIAELSRMSEP